MKKIMLIASCCVLALSACAKKNKKSPSATLAKIEKTKETLEELGGNFPAEESAPPAAGDATPLETPSPAVPSRACETADIVTVAEATLTVESKVSAGSTEVDRASMSRNNRDAMKGHLQSALLEINGAMTACESYKKSAEQIDMKNCAIDGLLSAAAGFNQVCASVERTKAQLERTVRLIP